MRRALRSEAPIAPAMRTLVSPLEAGAWQADIRPACGWASDTVTEGQRSVLRRGRPGQIAEAITRGRNEEFDEQRIKTNVDDCFGEERFLAALHAEVSKVKGL